MRASIAILARNDEADIVSAINALDRAAPGVEYVVCVLDLNSADGTVGAARAFAALDARVRVHALAHNDRAQAFNDYVHRYAGDAEIHIFLDARVTPLEGAIEALSKALARDPFAEGATALAANGRSRRQWAQQTIAARGLNGQLFALRDRFLGRMRAEEIFLPVGLVGVDGLLAYLLLTDLQGGCDDTHDERLIVAEDAYFRIRSLGPNAADFKRWRGRLRRFARRHYENAALYPMLKQGGVAAMPISAGDLFVDGLRQRARPASSPIEWWFDRRARRALARFARR